MKAHEIYERLCSNDCNGIYGCMYGQPWMHCGGIDGDHWERDKVLFIEKEGLQMGHTGLIYIWGWPGPDYNFYGFDDYGKTWAFTEDEIEDPGDPPDRKWVTNE